jgi:thiol:disulfide interchange protein DsbD
MHAQLNLLMLVLVLVGSSLLSHADAAGPAIQPATRGQAKPVSIQWGNNLQKAAEQAKKTGKPILVQFTADWCTFCHKMLDETLSNEEIAQQVNECFIPVVLDADQNGPIVKALGVEAFPTTVVISADLKSANRIVGYFSPTAFETQLEPYCRETRARLAALAKQEKQAKPEEPKPIPQPGFDGLCLVSLLDDRKLEKGDERVTAVFNGQRLQFVSERHRRAFLTEPEKYWPMMDGRCPVASLRQESARKGDPATVAVYRGRLILFRSMAHREDFATDPASFMPQIAAGEQPLRF